MERSLYIEELNLYIKDNHILKNISCNIPGRGITSIIGPSGCGKSTLLRSLNRLAEITEGTRISGTVKLSGKDIYSSKCDITELRRKMGLLSQRPSPLPMSIYNNVAYGCRIHGITGRSKIEQTVRHYLGVTSLWDEVKDRLHSPASSLSIGQQQRLCLARGLAVEPEFILADEATSALDPISSSKIEELFLSLKNDYSIILVTHTLRQAHRISDYVIFMYMGEIIEAATAKEFFADPKEELSRKYIEGVFS